MPQKDRPSAGDRQREVALELLNEIIENRRKSLTFTRKLLKIVENCRKLLKVVGSCRNLLTIVGSGSKIVGNYRKLIKN